MAPSEGRRWIRAGSDAIDSATPVLVAARLALSDATLAMLAQQYKAALSEAERALEFFTQLGDRQGIAFAHMFAGAARGFQGETAEGTALLEAALGEFRQLGSRRAIGAALNYLGCLQLTSGYVAASRSFFREALDVLRSAGSARPATHIALLLAEAEFRDGDALQAVRLVAETLAAERALNDLDALTFTLVNLAAYLVSLERWDDAILHAREALSLSLDRQITAATIWALQHLAAISALRSNDDVAAALEDRRRAARLIGFVDSRIAELDMRREFTEQREYERARIAVENALGAEAADLMQEGRNWSEGRAANEGLLI
jgi:tetratricopeptide (TPR) repeat protein